MKVHAGSGGVFQICVIVALCVLLVILPVSADNRENGTVVVKGSGGSDNFSAAIDGARAELTLVIPEPQPEITQSPTAIETAVVKGSIGSDNVMVTSTVVAPVVGFTGTPTSGISPLTVAFTDTSTNTPTGWAWYFGDENYTTLWTQVNASAGWSFRSGHSSVAMPDGSIVVMGGFNNVTGLINDVWQSTDNGATWTQVTASAGWSPRYGHSGVVLADGSILVMGGFVGASRGMSHPPPKSSVSRGFADGSSITNDVWRSTDNGTTWTQMTANAGWSARSYQRTVVMPDGSIVLLGGADTNGIKNDVWRSTDNGTTWTQMTANAGWSARSYPSSVVMPDGSIVLAGGEDITGVTNDVWRSTDNGATWTLVTASAGWAPRYGHSSVAMPDGSIVLLGGFDGLLTDMNDVWRSTDNGATWTQVAGSAGWSARYCHSSIAMPDGSIVLAGGANNGALNNDVWRIVPTGSSAQNPSHTYTTPGIYPVALQVYNHDGYNSMRKTGYISVTVPAAPVANFAGTPTSGNAPLTVSFTDSSTGTPTSWNWSFGDGGYSSGQNPVYTYAGTGSFTVSLTATNSAGSTTKTVVDYITGTDVSPPSSSNVGVYRPGDGFYLKMDNPPDNTLWNSLTDLHLTWDNAADDLPIAGDWNNDGTTETGMYRPGDGFYLKMDNPPDNTLWNSLTDLHLTWDNAADDLPIAGDWNKDGYPETGVYRPGDGFYLKMDNTNTWTPLTDLHLTWDNAADDLPIAGDWNKDGYSETGVYRPGDGFYLKMDNSNPWNSNDLHLTWDNAANDVPVAGRWILAGYPINSPVFTTVDHTIAIIPVPSSSPVLYPYQVSNYTEYGYGRWNYGPGLPYERREDLLRPGYNNTSVVSTARLLNYFTVTDIHITDEESPVSAIFLGYMTIEPAASSAYSPVMMLTTQNFDAVVQTINALHLRNPFDFGMSIGDAANSDQYNELRWYIDVLDGKPINPDSGVKDDPVPGPYNDYQDQFKAAGLNSTIPWFQTLGNHDHFYTGFLAPNDYFRNTLIGTNIINLGYAFTNPLGMDSRGYYMGSIDGRTPYGNIIGVGTTGSFTSPPQVLAADPNRHSLTVSQWIAEFFNTTSSPVGHGFSRSNVDTGFASYSFDPKANIPIRVIVLDDTQADTDPINPESLGMGHASLDMARYNWLVGELERGQAENKLMIISAHIPIGVSPAGSDGGWNPIAPITEQQLISTLHSYPNLLLWISGHRHVNQITPFNSTDPVNHPDQGFWEVETSSLRDLPQEFRTFEIVRNSDNTVSIITTDVDPAVSAGTLAAQSRSYGVSAQEIFSNPLSPAEGSADAILVKELSPEMQVIIQNYGTPIGK